MSRNYKFHNPEGTYFGPDNAGFVPKPEDYLYSSALDYCGMKGLFGGLMFYSTTRCNRAMRFLLCCHAKDSRGNGI